jgi:ADP-heptose:LPS heptosyltransferase
MGDLIQSTALFQKIKIVYPDSRVTLLMLTDFAGIGQFLPCIDEVKYLNLRGLSDTLKSNNFTFTAEVLTAVNKMLDGTGGVRYDLAVNLSHDEFSVYFLYMLNAEKNIGISITREGAIISNDEMISYMFSAVKNRKVSVLNLVDIYERALKSKDTAEVNVNKIYLDTEGKNSEARSILKEYGIENGDTVVSFAIGASTPLKKWRYDYFAELAKLLLNHNSKIKIVLLGADYDVEAGNYIETEAADRRLINLTGKTSVSDLVFLVKRSSLLITHDTGTMHIGTALGTKLIVIYTGNVGFLETGPYAEGQLLVVPDIDCFPCDFNLKCMNPVCKDIIKPEYVFDMAVLMLNRETGAASSFKKELLKFKDSGIIPVVSRFDSQNFIDFLPVFKGRLTFKDLNLKILKTALEFYYTGGFSIAGDCENYEVDVFLDSFGSVEYNLEADIGEELRCTDKLYVLCEKGMGAAKSLAHLALHNPFDMGKIDGAVNSIKSIDFELKYISSAYDEFSLFNQIHVINQNSSVSYDIFGLAVDSLKSYSGYKRQLKIFKDTAVMFLGGINKKN